MTTLASADKTGFAFDRDSLCSDFRDRRKKGKSLVHALKFKNKIGNPIGFDILVLNKFQKIKGDVGAKFMVKKLKKTTNFIKVSSNKIFKDFDYKRDFN